MSYAQPALTPSTAELAGPIPRTRLGRDSARLLFASLALPVALERAPGGGWQAERRGSLLARAIPKVLRERRGAWVGWPGVPEEEAAGLAGVLAGAIEEEGWSLRPVWLDREEARLGARADAGELLAPSFEHGGPWSEPAAWLGLRRLGRKFAQAVARASAPGDFAWAHGEALLGVGGPLRRLAPALRSGLFVPGAFPAPERFLRLPGRRRLLASLLAWDQLGFQTARDLEAFLACVRRLEPAAELEALGPRWILRVRRLGRAREVAADAFPMGIDFHDVARRAARPEVAAAASELRAALGGRRIVLAIDRLDAAQGTTWKLRAFRDLLTRRRELRGEVSLLLWVEPDPECAPASARRRSEIERLVGEINGGLGAPGWVPVHYRFRAPSPRERLAAYRAADVALFTPLAEGLGLAAKELCAANLEESGVLVLSELDGAAHQMACGALVVNPFDVGATAAALRRALRMGREERGLRMRRLREAVRREDVHHWAESFLTAALALRPGEMAPGRQGRTLQGWS